MPAVHVLCILCDKLNLYTFVVKISHQMSVELRDFVISRQNVVKRHNCEFFIITSINNLENPDWHVLTLIPNFENLPVNDNLVTYQGHSIEQLHRTKNKPAIGT